MDVQPLPRGKEKMSTHLGAGTPGKTSHQPPSARSGGEPLLQIARSSLPDLHLAVQLPDRQVAAVGAEGTLLHPLHFIALHVVTARAHPQANFDPKLVKLNFDPKCNCCYMQLRMRTKQSTYVLHVRVHCSSAVVIVCIGVCLYSIGYKLTRFHGLHVHSSPSNQTEVSIIELCMCREILTL